MSWGTWKKHTFNHDFYCREQEIWTFHRFSALCSSPNIVRSEMGRTWEVSHLAEGGSDAETRFWKVKAAFVLWFLSASLTRMRFTTNSEEVSIFFSSSERSCLLFRGQFSWSDVGLKPNHLSTTYFMHMKLLLSHTELSVFPFDYQHFHILTVASF